MTGLVWMDEEETLVIHDMQLAEHGGLEGVRDEGLPRGLEIFSR